MCGLFGFSSYNKEPVKNLSVLTNSLAVQSSIRGTDATGIAFNYNGLHIHNPLSILHFPEKKIYVYTSTDDILYKAIVDSMLFEDLKKGSFNEVPIREGEILKINPDGTLEKETFTYSESFGCAWWEYGFCPNHRSSSTDQEYLDILRTMAWHYGIEPEEIDVLLAEGFTLEEVEEYLYEI